MTIKYSRVTFRTASGARRTVWAEDLSKPDSKVRRFMPVNQTGDKPEPLEILFLHHHEVIDEARATMNLKYGQLEISR